MLLVRLDRCPHAGVGAVLLAGPAKEVVCQGLGGGPGSQASGEGAGK